MGLRKKSAKNIWQLDIFIPRDVVNQMSPNKTGFTKILFFYFAKKSNI
jgi:hypothetical protein